VDIRFVSSLTPDDENRLAPQLLNALGGVLDSLPIAYTLRIETTAGRAYAHNHVPSQRAVPLKVETLEIAASRNE